jgi:hypothetical protein
MVRKRQSEIFERPVPASSLRWLFVFNVVLAGLVSEARAEAPRPNDSADRGG